MIAKAMAAGAGAAVLGCAVSGAEEAPGAVSFSEGKAFKAMGGAAAPSSDHYKISSHAGGGAPYIGPVAHVAKYIAGELKVALAYAGAKDIQFFNESAELVRA
jgi:IMP dehydrogenase